MQSGGTINEKIPKAKHFCPSVLPLAIDDAPPLHTLYPPPPQSTHKENRETKESVPGSGLSLTTVQMPLLYSIFHMTFPFQFISN